MNDQAPPSPPGSIRGGGSISQAEDATIMIFGASGDLTARKLIPALYSLWKTGFLPEKTRIIGVARREKTDESWRDEMFTAVSQNSRTGTVTPEDWQAFGSFLHYCQVDITVPEDYKRLKVEVELIEQKSNLSGRRIAYLATTPDLFLPSVRALSESGMVPKRDDPKWLRVVFEKPFGHDLESSKELTANLSRLLRENQIYRIDHYLGKETVQNILLFRFGNAVFEPLFNRNHVDHIQITVAESQGMERGRGGYYDQSGAMRDVLQNHVLQLLCLIAMEPPAYFRGNEIRDEKLKVLQALVPGSPGDVSKWVSSAQYAAAKIGDNKVAAYLDEDRIAPDSKTETFVAVEAYVDNWRWAGVPFYMRTGKRLPTRVTEIAIQFKHPPLNLFTTVECDGDMCSMVEAKPNSLVFRIQPQESISLNCSTKRPGMQYQVQPMKMHFDFDEEFEGSLPEAYERLLLDVMRGDSTLFTRSDELEAAWRFVQPILDYWQTPDYQPDLYAAGTWGPKSAMDMLTNAKRKWRSPK
jgi:glucose-6-phosphate 1-dehydrogenase